MDVAIGPIHFRNVNQAFDTLFDLCETTVVCQVGHTSHGARTFRISLGNSNPWIFTELLEPKGYAVTLAVKLENFNVDLVTNCDDLTRMLDSLPGHICNVKQAVNTTKVNERTVIGKVLDDTFDFLAFLQGFQQRFALYTVLCFKDCSSGNDNIVALLVQLDHLEFHFPAFKLFVLTKRPHINQ